MNLSTVVGILAGFLMLTGAIVTKTGAYKIFVNVPGILIVLGGTLCTVLISFPLQDVVKVFKVLRILLRKRAPNFKSCVEEIVSLSKVAPRGVLVLEREIKNLDDLFLRDGIEMVVAGYSDGEIREILQSRIDNRGLTEQSEAHIYHTMARFAPAFGMVGTLIGLIAMMVDMGTGNFNQLGPNMAIALVTTFYGLILANLVFRPIAVQLERRTEEELRFLTMITEGVIMIQKKWHPHKVEDYLNSFLPPRFRSAPVKKRREGERGGGGEWEIRR